MEKSKLHNIFFSFPIIGALSLVFRGILPFQSFVFVGLYFVFIVFYIKVYSINIFLESSFLATKKGYYVLIIAGIYLVVLIFTKSNNLLINKEIFRTLSIVLVFFFLFLTSYHKGLDFVKNIFFKGFLGFVLVFLIVFYGNAIFCHENILLTVNKLDYNMLAMYLLMAFIVLLSEIFNSEYSKFKIILINALLFILSSTILLTNSRRGIALLVLLILGTIILNVLINKFRKKLKLLRLFYLLILLTGIIATYLINNNNLRTYILYKIQSKEVKHQLNSTVNRYFSFVKKDPLELTFFPKSNLIYTIIKWDLINDLKRNKAEDYYNRLNYFALFVESKNELIEINNQALFFPDSIFRKHSFTNIPETYNVDFSFKNSFIPISFENCYISHFNSISTDYSFKYQLIDKSLNGRVMSLLPVSDSSTFKLEFQYFAKAKLKVDFEPFNSNAIDYKILLDTNYVVSEGINKKVIKILIYRSRFNKIKLFLDFKGAELITSDLNWERKRASKKLMFSPTEIEYDALDRNSRIFSMVSLSKHEEDFSDFKYDSLFNYHEDILDADNFSEYTNAAIIEGRSNSAVFNSKDTMGYIKKIIPTFPNTVYRIKFITNIHPNLLHYYIKRFPEVNPEYITFKTYSDDMNRIDNKYFQVVDSFYVNDCSSLRSLFVIGNKSRKDSLIINEFSMVYYKDTTIFKLSERQKEYGKNFKNLVETAKINRNIATQDSLLKLYNTERFDIYKDVAISRWERWKFSLIYFKSLNINERIIGDCLNYLTLFPKVFYVSGIPKLEYDYPHNPIISSFLYSGILGGIVYIIFILITFYGFIKKRRKLFVFFILYIIVFIFAFFSGNSHFSIPIFALLSLFPFFEFTHK